MTNELYSTLDLMIQNSENNNLEEVLRLNDSFEKTFHQIYHRPIPELGLLYDTCRQSCVLSGTFPEMHEKFLFDAKQRFLEIPKPD